MSPFLIKCPVCGDTGKHQRIARSEYSPVAPVILGGIVLALIIQQSRKARFRCGRCNEAFFAHTITSSLFLAFFAFLILAVVVSIVAAMVDGGD
jgi:hypothetical protein